MYRGRTVAAVIPAYNEEGFVGNVIDDLPDFIDCAYVVDDGSTDNTWEEISRHAKERNEAHDGHFEEMVVPIRHDENRGVGGAIKTGYLRARDEEIDLTVVLGGDDQMDPNELTRYLDPIVDGTVGYTKGNRFSRADDFASMPRFRLIGNVALSYVTKVASGYWETMDSQNGYTAISLDALERTDIEGMYEYYGYCNDLLVRLNAADVRVGDVPRSSNYAYSEGWKSHIDYKEYIPRVSGMLFRSFIWRLRRKYLLQGYNPLAPLYLLSMGVIGGATAGLAAALGRRKSDTGTWFASLVSGALLFLFAGVLDWTDNRHLELQIDPEESESEAEERGEKRDEKWSKERAGEEQATDEKETDEKRTTEDAGASRVDAQTDGGANKASEETGGDQP